MVFGRSSGMIEKQRTTDRGGEMLHHRGGSAFSQCLRGEFVVTEILLGAMTMRL